MPISSPRGLKWHIHPRLLGGLNEKSESRTDYSGCSMNRNLFGSPAARVSSRNIIKSSETAARHCLYVHNVDVHFSAAQHGIQLTRTQSARSAIGISHLSCCDYERHILTVPWTAARGGADFTGPRGSPLGNRFAPWCRRWHVTRLGDGPFPCSASILLAYRLCVDSRSRRLSPSPARWTTTLWTFRDDAIAWS